jgi:hypothetical protein
MVEQRLGRLEKVNLRNIWTHESSQFTPWLAEEENLRLLSETIGITLDLDSIEKEVGSFFADILCKDEDDRWVVIENQLERTDHKHLGQIFTYGAGLKASVVIWIAAQFTDEHIAALDWLNEITDESVSFFGVEVEVWRIGNSPAAPKFNVVSQPNDWSRGVTAGTTKEITPAKLLQLRFWQQFAEFLEMNSSKIKPGDPSAKSHMLFSLGRSKFSLAASASFYNSETQSFDSNEIRVDVILRYESAKDYLKELLEEKEQIEEEFGVPLTWYSSETGWRCRIYTRKEVNLRNEGDWPNQHQWLKENLEKMDQVFRRRIQAL